MTHPEELLAEYVDGSLEQDERAAVDAHLERCERCRDEVSTARRARGALAALPQVELPEGFRADRRARRVRPAPGTGHGRLRRTTVMVGAAAASIAAIAALAVLLIGHGANGPGAGLAAAPGEHVAAGSAYDAARVNALAASLAHGEKLTTLAKGNTGTDSSGAFSAGNKRPAAAPRPTSATNQRVTGPNTKLSPVACLRTAAGVPRAERSIRPVIVGSFDGTPAYIGAFRSAGSIRVVAASRSDCSVLYFTSRPIG